MWSEADIEILRGVVLRLLIVWGVWEFMLLQLRRLDRRYGTHWRREVGPLLESSGVGMGLWMGLRLLALAILFSRAIP